MFSAQSPDSLCVSVDVLIIWCVQMKGEAETAYTFSIVGKLRY